MKLTRNYIIAGVVVVLITALVFGAYQRPLPAVAPVGKLNPSAGSISQASVNWSPYGEQYIGVVGQGLSASYGPEKPLPTASIAKVMTALAILHEKPLQLGQQGPSITMTSSDAGVYQQELAENESVVKIAEGEQLSEYQALQAMLIASATNVADTTAVWAFGSMSNYLAFANQYAAQLGLEHTHFANDASGFSPATVSTPQDLAKLGQAALANPVIAQIVGQRSATLPVAGTVQNFDIDLGQAGIIGVKTGNTDQAGGAYMYAAKYQGLTIIGATMGAPDLGTALHDAPEILGSFEASLQINQPVKAGQVVAEYRLPWGGTVDAVAQKSLQVVGWQGDLPGVQVSLGSLKSPRSAGTQIGTVSAAYNHTTRQTPVVLRQSIGVPSPLWRIFHL